MWEKTLRVKGDTIGAEHEVLMGDIDPMLMERY